MRSLIRFILLAMLLPISFLLSAQNFVPGYIVDREGDTSRVLIRHQNKQLTPEHIHIRQSPNSEPQKLGVEDISAFGMEGDVFIRAVVERDTRFRNVKNLDHNKDPKLVTDTVFLQLLVNGEKSLYLYRDQQKQDNYYIWQDGRPVLLIYTQYLYEDETAKYQRENQTYKGQLINYMKDCRAVFEEINKADYETSSLISVFDYYYENCSEHPAPEYIFDKNKLKLKFRYGIFAGYAMSKIHFEGNSVGYYNLIDADFPNSHDFTAGGFIDLVFPWGKGNFSLNNELEFTQFNTSVYYLDYRSENQQYAFDTDFEYGFIRINSMLRYAIPIRKITVYANAGLSNQFVTEKLNQTYFVKTITGNEYDEWRTGIDTEPYIQGLLLGMGVRYSGIFAEFRYNSSDQLTRITSITFNWNQYTFTIGYMFNH